MDLPAAVERRMRWAVGLGRSAFNAAATVAANMTQKGKRICSWLLMFFTFRVSANLILEVDINIGFNTRLCHFYHNLGSLHYC